LHLSGKEERKEREHRETPNEHMLSFRCRHGSVCLESNQVLGTCHPRLLSENLLQ